MLRRAKALGSALSRCRARYITIRSTTAAC